MTKNAGGAELFFVSGLYVEFTYTNWRGETSTRRVMPVSLWFGTTEHHPDPQWLMDAKDIGKDFALRTFALKGVRGWA